MSEYGARRSLRIEKLTRLASWKSDIYPPEIWEQVFGYLTGLQLLRVRLVCHRWRDIITGCPSLMKKLRIRFQEDLVNVDDEADIASVLGSIDEDFKPIGLLALTDLIFQNYTIDWESSWWSQVGPKLTHLTFSVCFGNMSFVMSLLRQTPNLRSLQFREFFLFGTAEPDFKLLKLQELTVVGVTYSTSSEYTNLLHIFERIFPRIRDLRIREIWEEDFNVGRLRAVIRALSSTLEALEVDKDTLNILRDLPELTRLRRISFFIDESFYWESWARFFVVQRLIEDLVISICDSKYITVLPDIGRTVPSLKRLTLHITEGISDIDTDFLQFMPNLEYLELRGGGINDIVLYRRGNPRIKKLHLHDVDITGFWRYLHRAPQLERIVLNSCMVNDEDTNAKVLKKLRALEIGINTNISTKMMKTLLRKCPFLEEFEFSVEETYKDSFVLLACERCQNLRKLSLQHCPVTDACVDHIVRHGLALEELRISSNTLSREAIERLRATRNIRVSVVQLDEILDESFDLKGSWKCVWRIICCFCSQECIISKKFMNKMDLTNITGIKLNSCYSIRFENLLCDDFYSALDPPIV